MEEKELKNENNTITLDSLENNKREDEDTTPPSPQDGDKGLQGVKVVSLGKSLLGDSALRKGISVSVRGRNAGVGINSKNGGSVWKKKDEKGNENQKEDAAKKIDEESFPDLLESTEKIKSELAKEKDKKKKGAKELRKNDEGSFRYGSEKGKNEGINNDKRRLLTNNADASQNNEGVIKNWPDQANGGEVVDSKDNERIIDNKNEDGSMGYLMPGFKGKHMIGFYCFLKKGNQNPPPLPPHVPFDNSSFFDIFEKQNNLSTKTNFQGLSASQQMAQLGQGNQLIPMVPTSTIMNLKNINFSNSSNAYGNNNQNFANRINKMNSFITNDGSMRDRQETSHNRFMQNPEVSGLSTSNLKMFNESNNNINNNNNTNNSSMNNNVMRFSNYQNRSVRSFGQSNMNYSMNSMNNNVNDIMKNNYNRTSNSMGSVSAGGNMKQRHFNRRNERRDDKKIKNTDIDADTNWRGPLNKKIDEQKTNVGSSGFTESMENTQNNNNNISNNNNSNTNNYNNNDDNYNIINNINRMNYDDNQNANVNNNNMNNIVNNNTNMNHIANSNIDDNTAVNTTTATNTNTINNSMHDRMKRNFRSRNTNAQNNMTNMGNTGNFNRNNNFSSNRNYTNRNNNNNINRNNLYRNNNTNSNYMNNNMNIPRNIMNRGIANRNNAMALNNSGNNNNHNNNLNSNKNMNKNFMKRNSGTMHNFGNEGSTNESIVTNNLFNRSSGNNFQSASTPAPSSQTLPQ